VAASGNWDNNNKQKAVYPAAYNSTVFAVGATCKNGLLWDRSVYGYWEQDPYVDVVAPGGCYEVATTHYLGGYMQSFGGTSAAAPVVSGVAALLLAKDGSLTNEDLANIIKRTATDIEPWGYQREYGWGRVNAHRAVRFISGPDRQLIHGVISKENTIVTDSSLLYQKTFKNLRWCFLDSTLSDAPTTYLVRRYRLTGSATLGSPYISSIKNVWVRHKSGLCPGWPDVEPMDCLLEVGWGAVDTTGWDSSLVSLWSFTYALHTIADTSFMGYYPIHPDSVEIPYTAVLGPFDEDAVVEITNPNGGEQWGCGPSGSPNRAIRWTAVDDNGIDSVSLFWSLDGGATWPFTLARGEGNDSVWTWAVADEETCSTHSRIAVLAYDGDLDCNFDVSDAEFTAGRSHEGQWEPMLRRPRPSREPDCYAQANATILFHLPAAAVVSLKVYDVRGRLVRSLIHDERSEGTHRVTWDLRDGRGSRVPHGVYFYRFVAGGFADTGKVIVLK
jgi:hypothetical protein